jgi:hypothetical protein
VVDAPVAGLASIAWSRAIGDLEALEGDPAGWLLGVIDADGLQAEFTDRFPAFDRAGPSEAEWLTRAVNFGKPISRRIAERGSRVAALALLARFRSMRTRSEWLLVVAADAETDIG